MKIAFVCGFAWSPKGTVRGRAFPLACELVALGHETTIFMVPYDNLADSGLKYEKEGVCIHNIFVGRYWRLNALWLAWALAKAVHDYSPDIIHVFKPKGFAGVSARLLRNVWGHKFVLDCDDWEGWGGWNEIKDYPWLVKEFIDYQERSLIRSARAVTVASRSLTARIVQQLRKDEHRVFYLPNGASRQQLQSYSRILAKPQEERLGSAPVIFYAGHFERGDDIPFLCRGMARILHRSNSQFWVMGDGPELSSLKIFFEREKADVKFFPPLPYERYLEVVAGSDICVFPYPDNQVYRNKCSARIIDYMSMAKSVVTTSIGQNTEYIEHERQGLLVPPQDEPAFVAAVERLVTDESLRMKLGAQAHARVTEQFRWGGNNVEICLTAYTVK